MVHGYFPMTGRERRALSEAEEKLSGKCDVIGRPLLPMVYDTASSLSRSGESREVVVSGIVLASNENMKEGYSRSRLLKEFGQYTLDIVDTVGQSPSARDTKDSRKMTIHRLETTPKLGALTVSAAYNSTMLMGLLRSYDNYGNTIWELLGREKTFEYEWFKSVSDVINKRLSTHPLSVRLGSQVTDLSKIV